jgi:hypothetical protein
MEKEIIKLINDVASTVACAISDPSISMDVVKNHLINHLMVPSEIVEHCTIIIGSVRTEIKLNK